MAPKVLLSPTLIFDAFWTAAFGREGLESMSRAASERMMARKPLKGAKAVTGGLRSSISTLHKQWAKLEDEHHQLEIAINEGRTAGTELAPMRQRQIELLLEITSIVGEIRDAPATTTEDFVALLDVALEHELDLACDIAYYGPSHYPMTARLLCALSGAVPGFEFNSLRRWLSLPGQFEQLMGAATPITPIPDETGSIEQIGFGEP
jgi:hypothetical protein